jgi:hypothetical protein
MRKLKDPTELSGIFGESVSIRKVNGRIIITNRPKRKRGKPTEKVLAQQRTFKEASSYAKTAAANPEARALYATGRKGKHESSYTVALRDFMNPPEVSAIDATGYRGTPGDIILINATDDFKVTRVKLVVTDANGVVIEQGDAIDVSATRFNQWEYKAVSTNPSIPGTKIIAVAYDRPGNQGTAEISM